MKHPIASASLLQIGKRLVFPDCAVHVLGCYMLPEAERCAMFKSDIVYRHVFRSPFGPLVYTGKNLHLKQGQEVALCATIKRFERWGKREQIRLSRVKVIEKPAQILMDF